MIAVAVLADEVDEVISGVVGGLDVDNLAVAALAGVVENPVVDGLDHLVLRDVLIEAALGGVEAGAVGAGVVAVGVGEGREGVLGLAVGYPLVADFLNLLLGGLDLFLAELAVLVLILDVHEDVAEGDAVIIAVVAAGVEADDVVAHALVLEHGHVARLARGVKQPLGHDAVAAGDGVAEEALYLGGLGLVAHGLGDGLGEAEGPLGGAGLGGLEQAVGLFLGLGHGLVGDLLVGLLGLLAGLLVGDGLGDLDLLGLDEVVVEADGVEGVGVFVIVGVYLVGAVLEALVDIGAVFLGDVGPLEELAHEGGGDALAVDNGGVAVGAAQVIGGRHGLEAGDGGVYFLGGFLAEGVAGLDGGVPDGGHLGHVLQGRLTEIVVPGELGRLLLVRRLEALGNLEAEHGEEARLHGLLVEVGAGVEPEEGGVGAVLVGEVVVRGGVVVLILGVRELIVAHGDRSRAGVQQVGVEKHDDDDEQRHEYADDRPGPALLACLDRGLAFGQGLGAAAALALGLAALLVLRCAHNLGSILP